jgi:FkbM family methyltransferase
MIGHRMLSSRLKAVFRAQFPKQWIAYSIWRSGYREVELDYLSRIVPRARQSVDVGANLGVYSRALSKLTPIVHAFEPNRELAQLLRRTLPRNVIVHEQALSSRTGCGTLRTPIVNGRRVFGLASLEKHAAYPADQEAVRVAKLDDVLDGDVGFIKIDVEGHELRVLEGASSLIERCRPVLLIECEERHNPGGPAALFRGLKKAGYIGRFLREGIICDIGEFSLTRDQVGDACATYINNFFFFPDGDHLERLELLSQ